MSKRNFDEQVRAARALGDATRLAILDRLMEGPASPSDLIGAIGGPQPRMAHHLAILAGTGLADRERVGRGTRYTLRDREAVELVLGGLAALAETAAPCREPADDAGDKA